VFCFAVFFGGIGIFLLLLLDVVTSLVSYPIIIIWSDRVKVSFLFLLCFAARSSFSLLWEIYSAVKKASARPGFTLFTSLIWAFTHLNAGAQV
jgi:hypothetical protein